MIVGVRVVCVVCVCGRACVHACVRVCMRVCVLGVLSLARYWLINV